MGIQQLVCRRSRDLLVGVVMVVNRRGMESIWIGTEASSKPKSMRLDSTESFAVGHRIP